MMLTDQPGAAERLRHYGRKCDQHLNRVRLSHLLATAGLRGDNTYLESRTNELIRESFDDAEPDWKMKLHRGLHEVHLVALKAEFELYLNRVLTVIWTVHFTTLPRKAIGKGTVSLGELADAAVQGISGRDFIIQMVVPAHGLRSLVNSLMEATSIKLPKGLPGYHFSQWSQLQLAFEVRHLIEHRDGRVDSDFRLHVGQFWEHSSWGRRGPLPNVAERITIQESDVDCTYEAMRQTARLLTEALVLWDSRQPNPAR
jgi:hypothetical protein